MAHFQEHQPPAAIFQVDNLLWVRAVPQAQTEVSHMLTASTKVEGSGQSTGWLNKDNYQVELLHQQGLFMVHMVNVKPIYGATSFSEGERE